MSFKFVITIQGHTLKGSTIYHTTREADSAAFHIIRELGGDGTIQLVPGYLSLHNWTPDQTEIDLLRRLRDGTEYSRITAVGFIRRKANCSLEEANAYFIAHFQET